MCGPVPEHQPTVQTAAGYGEKLGRGNGFTNAKGLALVRLRWPRSAAALGTRPATTTSAWLPGDPVLINHDCRCALTSLVVHRHPVQGWPPRGSPIIPRFSSQAPGLAPTGGNLRRLLNGSEAARAACFDLITGSDQSPRSSPSCLLGLALSLLFRSLRSRRPRSNTSELPFVLPIQRPSGLSAISIPRRLAPGSVALPIRSLLRFIRSPVSLAPPISSLFPAHLHPSAARSIRHPIRSPPDPLLIPIRSPPDPLT